MTGRAAARTSAVARRAPGGLFADRDLDVTFVDGQGRPGRVAAGGADFDLTAVVFDPQLGKQRGDRVPAEWDRTVASTAAVHGLPVVDPEQVYRPAATSGAREA